MNKFENTIQNMDFDFLSKSLHAFHASELVEGIKDDRYFFLDVRTDEEYKYLQFPFAKHIPMNEVPKRLDELPKDKCIVTFCAAIFRASVVYAYLR